MDRTRSLGWDGAGPEAGAGIVLPSRRAAMDACLAALPEGPVLISGEPGVGKTWLAARVAAERGPTARWVAIDASPAMTPADLLAVLAHGLGLGRVEAETAATTRLALEDLLGEQAVDGRRWGLIVDEAHTAPNELLEEVRVLSNRLGRSEGFAALMLVGQTSLTRRLSSRPLAALEARLAARVHLRPIDTDEARELLADFPTSRITVADELEALHRDASGNPRRLLRLAGSAPSGPRSVALPGGGPFLPGIESEALVSAAAPDRFASRPPLHIEEGLIEVGWAPEPELAPALSSPSEPDPIPTPPLAGEPGVVGEEIVEDHYAALQAWDEWSHNQGRNASSPDASATPGARPARLGAGPTHVRAEGQHEFAPYSQLFSRLRQAEDSET